MKLMRGWSCWRRILADGWLAYKTAFSAPVRKEHPYRNSKASDDRDSCKYWALATTGYAQPTYSANPPQTYTFTIAYIISLMIRPRYKCPGCFVTITVVMTSHFTSDTFSSKKPVQEFAASMLQPRHYRAAWSATQQGTCTRSHCLPVTFANAC